MTARDRARCDLIVWIRAYHCRRPVDRMEVEQRYGLTELPPAAVTVGLLAASRGQDVLDAVEDHLEGSD